MPVLPIRDCTSRDPINTQCPRFVPERSALAKSPEKSVLNKRFIEIGGENDIGNSKHVNPQFDCVFFGFCQY
jgi:hypothetical protein